MATNKGVKVFNAIRSNSSDMFKNVVPMADANNISTLSNILFNDAYQPQLNEFVNNLINRIALTIVRNKSYNNPLSILKKGSVPLGTDIQDIYENPAEREQYEYSNEAMAKLLTITDPDTNVAYYRRNRQDLYTKTISREGLQGAFVSWEQFEDYISSITNSLYSGNYIDEFKFTKDLVKGAYENGKAIVEVVDDVTDSDSAKKFLKKARALFNKMSFPSTEYNAFSKMSESDKTITTWTEPERVILMVKADVMAEVDVEALASAFNLDKADFLGRVIQVDDFGNDDILGIICDESFFQIYDNIFRFDEFYNARTMSWNEYLHVWQTFAICPFANAVILSTKEGGEPATSISLDSDEYHISQGEGKHIYVYLEPENASRNITFESSNLEIFDVEETTEVGYDGIVLQIIGLNNGSAELTVTTSSGLSATASVIVGVPAESISLDSETYTITGIGTTENVTATLTPEDSTSTIFYSSSNSEVFTIEKDVTDQTKATITSVGVGEATLTVATDNEKSATASVTVSAE